MLVYRVALGGDGTPEEGSQEGIKRVHSSRFEQPEEITTHANADGIFDSTNHDNH